MTIDKNRGSAPYINIMFFLTKLLALFLFLGSCVAKRKATEKVDAVVSLVAGESSGYDGGAIALGQSLIDVGSKLHRVLLVDKEVRCLIKSKIIIISFLV